MIEIKMLEASEGDCFLLKIKTDEKNYNILIDGGPEDTYYDCLEEKLEEIFDKGECIDLLIITHICSDHLDGIKTLFEEKKDVEKQIKKIWYNSSETIATYLNSEKNKSLEVPISIKKSSKISKTTGYTLEEHLDKLGYDLEIINNELPEKYLGEKSKIKFTFLSPGKAQLERLNKEWKPKEEGTKISSSVNIEYGKSIEELLNDDSDYTNKEIMLKSQAKDLSKQNGASIAFILEYNEKRLLFLGDSFDEVIINSLNEKKITTPLRIDVMKLSHHGSAKNISPAFLKMIDCNRFLISTDGVNTNNGHPNKRTLARIIDSTSEPITFYFNYDIIKKVFPNDLEEEKAKYKFQCCYLTKGLEI